MKKRALTLSALLIAASGAAVAQSPAERQATPPRSDPQAQRAPMPQSSDISDDDVGKFAQAQDKVKEIKGSYQKEVQANAQEPEKAMQIQQQAQQEMVQAVKDTGLEVQKYNQIAQLAQYDTDLRERINDSR